MMFRSLRTLRSIPRLKDIALILAKHGFHQMAAYLQAPIGARLRRFFSAGEPVPMVHQPERLRLVLQDLGPTFIKFGQLLSTRPDLVPEAYIRELSKLQDQVQPAPLEEILQTLSSDLGEDVSSQFLEFSPEPLASASIGQVHRAVTKDGRQVVVKVRKRGLARIIEQDLQVLHLLVEVLAEWPAFRIHDLEGILDAFERAIRRELDFTHESFNLRKMRDVLDGDATVHVPAVYPDLSSRRVLTMEYLEGKKFSELTDEELEGGLGERLAEGLTIAVLRQIFEHGIFHADPHPGNLILMANGRIGLIDFGNVGKCTPAMMEDLLLLLYHLVRRDFAMVTRMVLKVGRPKSEIDAPRLAYDLMDALDQYYGLPLERIQFGGLLNSLFALSMRYRISLPPQYVLLGRTLMTVEGVVRELAPKLEILHRVEPFLMKAVRARWSPSRLLAEVEAGAQELVAALRSVPAHLSEALKQASEGRFQVHAQLRNTEKLEKRLEFIGQRVPLAIVISGTLVASALLLFSAQGKALELGGILGAFGFLASLVLVFWLAMRS
jgi:ubiquinone biosynthesis protein